MTELKKKALKEFKKIDRCRCDGICWGHRQERREKNKFIKDLIDEVVDNCKDWDEQ